MSEVLQAILNSSGEVEGFLSFIPSSFFLVGLVLLGSIVSLFSGRFSKYVSVFIAVALFVLSFVLTGGGKFLQFEVSEWVLSAWRISIFVVLLTFLASEEKSSEFYFLVFLSLAGVMLFVSSRELFTALISFELVSLPFYVISAREPESGAKFFTLGAVASLFFALSVFAVFSEHRTTYLDEISEGIWLIPLTLALAFKVGSFPFHFWVPDTYSGTLSEALSYLSVAPKLAGVFFIAKLAGKFEEIRDVIFALSLLSMIYGNVVALWQRELKRLLAYSGIAHIGYALVGAIASSYEAVLFYFVFYAFANVGSFTLATVLEDRERQVELSRIDGLKDRMPAGAVVLTSFFLSLGGVPPVLGFWAKLYVFLKGAQAGFIHLALVGAITSIVALFYYLSVIRRAFISPKAQVGELKVSFGQVLALFLCFVGTTLLALYPKAVIDFVR